MPVKLTTIRHVIITGASGYIGKLVADEALASGATVTALARRPPPTPAGVGYSKWLLGDELPETAINPAVPLEQHAVVHLAHDWSNPTAAGSDEAGLNLAGTRTLLMSCRSRGIGRFVFASSQSARADAPNIYGRAKWQTERLFDRANEVSARIGLVYGGRLDAMYGLLVRLCRIAPILPMVEPSRLVQPIHVREVAQGLLLLAESRESGWVGLATPDGIAFGRFLKMLAAKLHGRTLVIIPIPLQLALFGCRMTAIIPFIPTVDKERILGLAGTRTIATKEHLERIALQIKPCAEMLADEPLARKALLAEGGTLLRYVLRGVPSHALLRRYARAVRAKSRAGPLALSPIVRRWPFALRLTEPLASRGCLAHRLALATSLAEASPEGELALSRGHRAYRIVDLTLGILIDALLMPARLIADWFRR